MSPRFVPTPEQRAAGLARSRELRGQRALALRSDFPACDEAHWQELAEAAGVKLPPYGSPVTTGAIERWLARLGIPVAVYLEEFSGYYTPSSKRRLSDWPQHNPTAPLKVWVGLQLEYLERKGRLPILEAPGD